MDANGDTKVFSLSSAAGLTEWVDYIPVQSVSLDATVINKTDPNGFRQVNVLASDTGLLAFKDYIPVFVVQGRSTPWNTGSDGYIPMYAATGGFNPDAPDPTFSNTVIVQANFEGTEDVTVSEADDKHATAWTAAGAAYQDGGSGRLFGANRAFITGTGDWVGIASGAADINTQDFAIEAIIEFSDISADRCVTASSATGAGNKSWEIWWDQSTNELVWWDSTTGNIGDQAEVRWAFTPSTGVKYEIAIGRDTNGIRCCINGTQIGSDIAHTRDIFWKSGLHVFCGYNNDSDQIHYGNGMYFDCFRYTIGECHITGSYNARSDQYPTS
jgi:hypothetical protein